MYDSKAVKTLSNAIYDKLSKELDDYIELRKSDELLKPEIEKIVNEIEFYEDLIENSFMKISNENLFENTISIAGYTFKYNEEIDAFEFWMNKERSAKDKVYNIHKLYRGWYVSEQLRHLIEAIVTTLTPAPFEEIVEIVNSKIDFNELLTDQK